MPVPEKSQSPDTPPRGQRRYGLVPRFAQITANLHPFRTLATLDDALLPELLSGELSVAHAEEVVHNPERQTA